MLGPDDPIMTNMALEPGSPAARAVGCICPDSKAVFKVDGDMMPPVYQTDPDCPCHGLAEQERVHAMIGMPFRRPHKPGAFTMDQVRHWAGLLCFWAWVFIATYWLFAGKLF